MSHSRNAEWDAWFRRFQPELVELKRWTTKENIKKGSPVWIADLHALLAGSDLDRITIERAFMLRKEIGSLLKDAFFKNLNIFPQDSKFIQEHFLPKYLSAEELIQVRAEKKAMEERMGNLQPLAPPIVMGSASPLPPPAEARGATSSPLPPSSEAIRGATSSPTESKTPSYAGGGGAAAGTRVEPPPDPIWLKHLKAQCLRLKEVVTWPFQDSSDVTLLNFKDTLNKILPDASNLNKMNAAEATRLLKLVERTILEAVSTSSTVKDYVRDNNRYFLPLITDQERKRYESFFTAAATPQAAATPAGAATAAFSTTTASMASHTLFSPSRTASTSLLRENIYALENAVIKYEEICPIKWIPASEPTMREFLHAPSHRLQNDELIALQKAVTPIFPATGGSDQVEAILNMKLSEFQEYCNQLHELDASRRPT